MGAFAWEALSTEEQGVQEVRQVSFQAEVISLSFKRKQTVNNPAGLVQIWTQWGFFSNFSLKLFFEDIQYKLPFVSDDTFCSHDSYYFASVTISCTNSCLKKNKEANQKGLRREEKNPLKKQV